MLGRIKRFHRDLSGATRHVVGAAAISGTMAVPVSVVNYTFPRLTVSEGLALVSYYDPVGILTDCIGNTHNVHVGEHKTRQQCLDETAAMLPDYWGPIVQASPVLGTEALPVSFRSSWLQFTWNEGTGTFGRYIAPQINAITGKPYQLPDLLPACDHMLHFTGAGGNPTLLLTRRLRERADCMSDL